MSAKFLNDFRKCSLQTISFWRPNLAQGKGLMTCSFNFNGRRNAHTTIEAKDYFQANKCLNWDPEGPFRPLYALNYLRVPYIRDRLVQVEPGEKFSTCLKGKKIIDVGCGGGFLSEALAKLGAEVTGIDINKDGIAHAKDHSSKSLRLANNIPTFIETTVEEYCKEHAESYDVVISSEVIDHVAHKELFVESCVRLAKPGGKLFISTINRTRLAQFVLIFVYEDIFKAIEKGVHEFHMFVKPNELKYMLEMNDCSVESIKGYFYYPLAQHFEWTKNTQFLYFVEAVKPSN